MKVAIVHDYLNQFGGAERVVEVLHECFPEAPIFTSIYLPDRMPDAFRRMEIYTSFMQHLPLLNEHFKKYLLLYPSAFQSFDLSEYDIVLSSSSAWAKGVRKNPSACHICYCYTPMRWVWKYEDYVARENFGPFTRRMLPIAIKRLSQWDLATNEKVDHFIAISNFVAERISRCYGRDSTVIYPPVNTSLYKPGKKTADFYLIVSRLNTYKKIELAIQAFNELRLPLRIVGTGPYESALRKMAGPSITFVGKARDEELAEHYAKCRALVFPGEEDFGIAPVEAQAAGRPVIAFAAGGALETVVESKTGIFFREQTPTALIDAVRQFEKTAFAPETSRANAEKFDRKIFIGKLRAFVKEKYQEGPGRK
jgi:glycosyltransferase involved in cell wall biosynthesis